MIRSVYLKAVATYVPDGALDGLAKVNYIFGSNGSGKTTIGRVIADEQRFPTCSVQWDGGAKLEALVYNCDFVERNFNQANDLPGVFTLGEKNLESLSRIASLKAEIDGIGQEVVRLTATLEGGDGKGGKRAELRAAEEAIKERCWAQKKKYDGEFKDAFTGVRNNADNFKAKILQEDAANQAEIKSLEYLRERAASVFGTSPSHEMLISRIDGASLIRHSETPILGKRVVGKADVDIAALIKELSNSDWVRQGQTFYERSAPTCPFCQQTTRANLHEQLERYFDTAYEADLKSISALQDAYERDAARVLGQLEEIIRGASGFLDVKALKAAKDALEALVNKSKTTLAKKAKEPSCVVALESLTPTLSTIDEIINAANGHIQRHNELVANLGRERATLTAQVWRYLLNNELRVDLDSYLKQSKGLTAAIVAIEEKIRAAKQDAAQKMATLRELEKSTTSVVPTIDGINSLLASFGFFGFRLAKASDGPRYKLVRADGADARETLSEGEKTFVTFLYFYHLLKGSGSESGVTVDRVVVFDDPVSSLDSDVLFVVSSLIKGLVEEVRAGSGHVKQVFVMTHNIYFHKEVTFHPRRSGKFADETFWIVRKMGLTSKLEQHNQNPIRTSYELLWEEVRKADGSSLTIQNTLRRILETYFKVFGGVDSDEICALFEGKDKMICGSLFSWVNDGSHFARDDLYIAQDSGTVERYLLVFREIFRKAKHEGHYNMMMGLGGIAPAAPSAKAVPAPADA